ncbi:MULTISPECIES: LptA/OstA family protein [unclassified Mesorhizobium]|uniref:LptA/OstA family protein n=1 Tax=unclassified Mesorhizobium TaxID=325217 RepID=UPI001CCDC74A|nr:MULTISPECIES: LptA/OstA family protein [unclassified Mesorhizobium]MBZ9735156.1 LPS ABC transporter substrate-binding protein LptA [Mesorhizobium sp. CA9]MBZ9770309.1 LPS ABC transporter substrate-binding protein LptA [Mesorhizobium sp. CA6]MBZ9817026.1 LPS ABC transporter substrate-binding protein LptA [Mesorhizobium sp. CA7]MBZ9828669.1 LPS ABC transporter substrate-binding protein LptA [Mesorhizobium sp. CA18]MBZ9833071.1 LPS ABC transporter substrate-binding protein LptA [Mesorhizobium 
MRRSKSAWLPGAASALLFLATAHSFAQSSATSQIPGLKLSGDQPIQIESDKLEVRQAESMAVFSGNVTVNQGPTLLKAGKMTVYYVKDANAGKSAAAGASAMTGAANIDHLEVENKVYIKSNDQIATGDTGKFDMKTQVLVLSGKEVVLSQGDNVLKGCKLTVQMKSGLGNVEGCPRVIMMFKPQKQDAQQGASSK